MLVFILSSYFDSIAPFLHDDTTTGLGRLHLLLFLFHTRCAFRGLFGKRPCFFCCLCGHGKLLFELAQFIAEVKRCLPQLACREKSVTRRSTSNELDPSLTYSMSLSTLGPPADNGWVFDETEFRLPFPSCRSSSSRTRLSIVSSI